jgi:NAD(P)-dependent dehydrogenase (short-subunit alcohol dehydrogenase family)
MDKERCRVDELFSVRDKTVMITGGSSGLGLQLVRLFLQRGAKVCSVAKHHEAAVCQYLLAGVRFHPPVFVEADLTGQSGVDGAFHKCCNAFGPAQILFNNAGLSLRKKFLDVSRDDWNHLADINLKGMYFVGQTAAKRMQEAGIGGSIINMSSILGNKAITGTSVYSATKAGVAQMTRSMAHELGPLGIRVNAIAPGWFETRMTVNFLTDPAKTYLQGVNPLRRLGQAGDLDGVALLLASQAGAYINGAVIPVDGGQSLSG